jgi:hypothetical protein
MNATMKRLYTVAIATLGIAGTIASVAPVAHAGAQPYRHVAPAVDTTLTPGPYGRDSSPRERVTNDTRVKIAPLRAR